MGKKAKKKGLAHEECETIKGQAENVRPRFEREPESARERTVYGAEKKKAVGKIGFGGKGRVRERGKPASVEGTVKPVVGGKLLEQRKIQKERNSNQNKKMNKKKKRWEEKRPRKAENKVTRVWANEKYKVYAGEKAPEKMKRTSHGGNVRSECKKNGKGRDGKTAISAAQRKHE